MTIATLFILCTGLLAMTASLGVAWWLWTYDPVWPWTKRSPALRPTGSHVAIHSGADAHPRHVATLEPVAEVDEERMATMFFIKGKSKIPEKTEILADRHEWMGLERDDDAPAAYEDQLQTTPNQRAGPPPLPPESPRY
jgi:hypothetical protein